MKGIVFNLLNEMVEDEFGFSAWESILEKADSRGVFVATETYPDADLMALVLAAETVSGVAANELIYNFGKYMVPKFAQFYPMFFENQSDLKSFLLTVDQVIHVEVRKLYPDVGLPEFRYQDEDDTQLTMIYRSPRKLCVLAEGLIAGSAQHFQQSYSLSHKICMHSGSDHCELEIDFR